jgi:hypothetical protein
VVVVVVVVVVMMMMSRKTFDLFINFKTSNSGIYATNSSLLEDSSDHLQYIPSKSRKEFTSDFALHRRKHFSIKEL